MAVLGVVLGQLILDHDLRWQSVIFEFWSRSIFITDLWLWSLVTFSVILIIVVNKRSDHIHYPMLLRMPWKHF